MDVLCAWLIGVLVGALGTILNVITLVVIVNDRKLRKRVSSFPLLSFLLGSILQGLLAAPLYTAKKIGYSKNVPTWLCDTSRLSYFFCAHVLKMSLLLVSVDRLFALRHTYLYQHRLFKRNFRYVIAAGWFLTAAVDFIPFIEKSENGQQCSYVPSNVWGLSVIVLFNLAPFCIILLIYIVIWMYAAEVKILDRRRNLSLLHSDAHHVKSQRKMLFEMKATKTSILLLLSYVICWGPLGFFYTIDHFCANCLSEQRDIEAVKVSVKVVSFASCVITPVVYCWRNEEFLKAFKRFRKKKFQRARVSFRHRDEELSGFKILKA